MYGITIPSEIPPKTFEFDSGDSPFE